MSVFVQMTSYRNFDLVPTIRDCIENSADKDNLYFGVCLQQDEEVPPEIDHPRIKVQRVPYKESPGPGWAKSVAQSFYDGQDYVLQVDAGSRFAEKWDEQLIDALKSTKASKPIITNYPNKYNPSNGEKEQPGTSYKNQVHQMIAGVPSTWPFPMKGATSIIPSRWINENFFFAHGRHCTDVKFDPDFYYCEFESALTLRSFCAGYDIFSHYLPMVWRDYSQRPVNWADDPEWWLKDRASQQLLVLLLNNQRPEEFNLSSVRSLRDFELYSGIDFKGSRIQRSTISGDNPPCKYENEEQWNREYLKDNMITVSWDISEIEKCDDYDYWYFAIEDENGVVLNRQDLRQERDSKLLNFQANFKKVYFKTISGVVPKKLCIQPVSKSKGWLKKVKFDIA